MKYLMSAMLIIAALLGLYMLTIGLPLPPKDETANLPAGVELLKVTASQDFVFDKKEYTVKAGQKYKLVLTNKSGLHGLAIEDFGINLQGDKLEQEVTFDKPGRYKMHCSVMCGTGHPNMVSELVVE
jgi:cytochrome c oxidase subunit 2